MSEPLLGKTRTRSILIGDITDEDALKWAALAEKAREPNAFFHPAFLLPYADATALYPDRRQIVSLLIAPGWLSGLFLRARPHLLDVRQAMVRLIDSATAFHPEGISR